MLDFKLLNNQAFLMGVSNGWGKQKPESNLWSKWANLMFVPTFIFGHRLQKIYKNCFVPHQLDTSIFNKKTWYRYFIKKQTYFQMKDSEIQKLKSLIHKYDIPQNLGLRMGTSMILCFSLTHSCMRLNLSENIIKS